VVLAGHGYRVHQNPTKLEIAMARDRAGDVVRASAEPDYLVEGRVFDCYSPTPTKAMRGVWSETRDKIAKQQTQRVVINLQDWQGDINALRQQFATWPIPGLKEVKVITKDGQIIQFPHA
jgi:hypothetical protein